MKRLFLIAVIALIGCFSAISAPEDFGELQDAFTKAVPKGDSAAVKAMSVESEADKIWAALQSRNVDKARDIFTRGAGYKGDAQLPKMTGYYDLTARMPDGPSVAFRVELINSGSNPTRGWKIQAIKFD